MSTTDYSIILATYNERENLPLLIDLIAQTFNKLNIKNYEVIVVDDNSPDNTATTCTKLAVLYPECNITLHKRKKKLGLGTAYAAGFIVSKGDNIIILDSDLSHQPKYIANMIKKKDETNADIVCGTRYEGDSGTIFWPLKRRFYSALTNYIVKFLFQTQASDVTGSFRLYTRDAFKLLLSKTHSIGFSFQLEAIILASKYGYKIGNVPIVFVDRILGESTFGRHEFKEIVKCILRMIAYPVI